MVKDDHAHGPGAERLCCGVHECATTQVLIAAEAARTDEAVRGWGREETSDAQSGECRGH